MPGQKTKVGPWSGGLNQRDDPRLIDDKDLAAVLNFDITNEGTLRPRRPCRVAGGGTVLTGTKQLLGSVIESGTTFGHISNFDTVNTRFYHTSNPANPFTSSYTGIARSGIFEASIQYNNFIWLIPGDTNGVGFRSTSLTGVPQDVPTMPFGDYAFMLKDRMFIVRKSINRVYYSKPTDPTVWAAPDGGFFDVNPGDGQTITKVVVSGNQVTIFKRDSTYIFSFTDNPTIDGGLRLVSSDQGAFDAIVYNNEIYTVSARSVFKFINGYFVDIASKIDLFSDSNLDRAFDPGCRLSIVNKTLMLGRTFNTKRLQDAWYSMNLDTGAWSEHYYPGVNASPSSNGILIRSNAGSFVLYGDGQANAPAYLPSDVSDRVLDEDTDGTHYPTYEFVTKNMTMGDDESWKRLFAWSVEVASPIGAVAITPAPQSELIVNDSLRIPVSADFVDRINTVSTRFRRIQMKWNAHRPGGTLCTIPKTTPGASLVAPKFYSITAWISENSSVVT